MTSTNQTDTEKRPRHRTLILIYAEFKMGGRGKRQLALGLRVRTWGGARPGAGRKRSAKPRVAHVARPALASKYPTHVTLRVGPEIGSLRERQRLIAVRTALSKSSARGGFRLVQFSVQSTHLHLIVEANGRDALAKGMQGLCIRLARGLNRLLRRSGRVFADRYHARILKTPREVRHALCYVLLNHRRHAAQAGKVAKRGCVDPCSSGAHFDGWRGRVQSLAHGDDPPVAPAVTWLLRVGWRRHGLLSPDEVPGAA